MLLALLAAAMSFQAQLSTSAGLTGSGNGGVRVTSAKKAFITDDHGQTCQTKAPAHAFVRVRDAVAKARPEKWNPAYGGPETDSHHARYSFELRRGKAVRTVQWSDEAQDELPGDLKHLVDMLLDLQTQALPSCMHSYR